MNIAIPVLHRNLKLQLFRVLRSVDMTPTSRMIIEFLIDDPGAPYWARTRFAAACRRHPRTIDLAFDELKKLGFVDVRYRRRQSSVKVLVVDAILHAVNRAVAIAKQVAKAAKAVWTAKAWARVNKLRSNIPPTSHLEDNREVEGAAWRVQQPPTAALLRTLHEQDRPKRY